jgi:hypothetical protein
MPRPRIPRPRRSPRTVTFHGLAVAAALAAVALTLLAVHVFTPAPLLQLVAVWALGGAFLAVWIAVLRWRIPVFDNRTLLLVAVTWGVGTALAVGMVRWTLASDRSLAWRSSIQAFALSVSLAAAALLLGALLRRRASPLLGRLLSLLSPLAIVAWIVASSLRG